MADTNGNGNQGPFNRSLVIPMPNYQSNSLRFEADDHQHESKCAHCAKNHDASKEGDLEGHPAENTFQVIVRLPHRPYKTQTIVSTQDQAQDVRQSIIDLPHTFQYSCFHLEHDGSRIPEYVDLADVPSIRPDVELTLVEDPYNEKEARLHVLRIRELIGAAGDRTELTHGIDAGLSLHDQVASTNGSSSASTSSVAKTNGSANHALSDFDTQSPASLNAVHPRPSDPPPKTVKSLSLSQWNPPPYALRSKGHLLYLLVTTNEGEQHHVTSHVTGFYINKSSNGKFDPSPRTSPKSVSAHSLLTLLSRISPSFDSSFKSLQDFNSARDPLSAFQLSNAIPASPWVVCPTSVSLSAHAPDICRTEENFLMSGAENSETLRDWNEEFQTTRELPRDTVQDRVFRERVTSKLFADYNEAAVQGAVLIARGEVAPLNPTEPRDAQIFVYNNVFYSFGADGVGTFANEGGDEAARVATGKDVMGVKTANQLDVPDLSTPGSLIVDYLGRRIVAQSIVPGIFKQRDPGENQIDYGGVEGREVVADSESFVSLFNKLSAALRVKKHPVWDKDGKRHDLEASIETKGLIGTDGRKYALDLYRLSPVDILWIRVHWDASDENQRYPHRMSILRPELIDSYWRFKLKEYIRSEAAKSPPQKDTQLKSDPESFPLVTGKENEAQPNGDIHSNKESENDEEVNESPKEPESERIDISGFQLALNPDAFCGQEPNTEEEREELSKDEDEVMAASEYLSNEMLPRLVSDIDEGEVGFPMDGQSLSALLHKRGINIRYLGKLAEHCSKPEPRLKAMKNLLVQEMVARAFKHVANRHLRDVPAPFAISCMSHLLNCFLGSAVCDAPRPEVDEDLRSIFSTGTMGFESLKPDPLLFEIAAQVNLRYRYTLKADWTHEIHHLQMLREVALKLGLQLVVREYQFESNAAPTNGVTVRQGETLSSLPNGHTPLGSKKKRKQGDRNSPSRTNNPSSGTPSQTFQPDDILNVVPVIKDSSPRSALAEEALEAGRLSVAQNQRELGQELLMESLSLHEQIYGILHPEVARVYYQLSTLFYSLSDKSIAVELARKAVIVSERTIGLDSNETLLAYLNLGLFEHAVGNTRLALRYVSHALNLWKIVYGPNHPDSITTLNNAAVMLQNLKLYHDSRIWFEASLNICQDVSGPRSVNTGTILFQLAQAQALDQDPKGAVTRMREAYNIFNAELGPNDRNTKEAESWLEQLTQNAVSIAKHAKDIQARKLRRFQNIAPRLAFNGRQQQLGNGRIDDQEAAEIAARASAVDGGARRLDERSVEELLKYIEGAGEGKQSNPSSRKKPANPRRRHARAT